MIDTSPTGDGGHCHSFRSCALAPRTTAAGGDGGGSTAWRKSRLFVFHYWRLHANEHVTQRACRANSGVKVGPGERILPLCRPSSYIRTSRANSSLHSERVSMVIRQVPRSKSGVNLRSSSRGRNDEGRGTKNKKPPPIFLHNASEVLQLNC